MMNPPARPTKTLQLILKAEVASRERAHPDRLAGALPMIPPASGNSHNHSTQTVGQQRSQEGRTSSPDAVIQLPTDFFTSASLRLFTYLLIQKPAVRIPACDTKRQELHHSVRGSVRFTCGRVFARPGSSEASGEKSWTDTRRVDGRRSMARLTGS